MARKTKDTEPKEPPKREQISPRKLLELMRTVRSAQKDITEIAGGLGAEIKAAVEDHHLHRKAFSVVKAGDKMEPEKLAEFLECLDHYLEISGLRKRAASAPRFEADEEESAERPPTGNVRPFPQPSGIAAE